MKQPEWKTELNELQNENRLLKQLGTRQGFFQYYFEQLPKHKTNVECFNYVNDKHLELFGEHRYESHYSFKRSLTYFHKSNKK
ncbi:hypothetical protein [Mesonia aquimarina]|uniref:hypothetical protein n=1 Tax=Mesonia aquimarina TaxID=1504967 RepID=UPI000EF62922|nr:hypothetical protein [Mesonia aquimarina]